MSGIGGRVPPHNNEAEIATLGAMLLNPEAVTRVIPIVRSRDFYHAAHQKVFDAVVRLIDRAERPDLITVTEELRSSGELEGVGGPGYVAQLTSEVPAAANVEYYAKIVRDTSTRRRLISIADQLRQDAFDDAQDVRLMVEEAERRIFEITDESQIEGYKPAREIIERTVEAIEHLYRHKESYTGVPSGLTELDNMLSGFQDSEFIVVGARPSIGKTALALSMAANMALHRSTPVGFFTLEMSDMALMQRLVSSEARIGSQKIRTGYLLPADFKNLTDAAGLIYDAPLFITDQPNMKLLDLRAQARRMRSQAGVRIIFIDYITLIRAENPELPRHEQIAEVSRSLKALARELSIPIVALSQVSRDSEGRRPTLANIRESGSIEQDADVVLFLHRERGTNEEHETNNVETELIVAKQRNGPQGIVKIAFVPQYTRFENLAHEPV